MYHQIAVVTDRDELIPHHLQTTSGAALSLQVIDEFAIGGSPQRQETTAHTGDQVAPAGSPHLKQVLIPGGALYITTHIHLSHVLKTLHCELNES